MIRRTSHEFVNYIPILRSVSLVAVFRGVSPLVARQLPIIHSFKLIFPLSCAEINHVEDIRRVDYQFHFARIALSKPAKMWLNDVVLEDFQYW